MHVITLEGEEHDYAIKLAFKISNNEAEYKAFLSGLVVARALGAMDIKV